MNESDDLELRKRVAKCLGWREPAENEAIESRRRFPQCTWWMIPINNTYHPTAEPPELNGDTAFALLNRCRPTFSIELTAEDNATQVIQWLVDELEAVRDE